MALVVVVLAGGCTQGRVSSADAAVRFEIRGLKTRAEDGQYGITYTHTATILAHGDSAVLARPYTVLLTIRRLSGGDPDQPRQDPDYGGAIVVGGTGDLAISGGYKSKGVRGVTEGEKWEPEKIEVRIIGYDYFTPIRSEPVRMP
jgi:hypothetical protein